MTEQTATRLWAMRAAFTLVVCVVLFFHLLPLDTSPRRWVGPDLLFAFACAWSLRRPEYVPALLLALLFLLADFLLFRPPGLWAMLALMGCEHLKSRARGLRDGNFLGEWLSVALVMAALSVAYRVLLTVTLVHVPGLGLSVFELAMSVAFYPVAVAITIFLLGVRKAGPGELGAGGGTA